MTAEPSFESMLRGIIREELHGVLGGGALGADDEIGVSIDRAAQLLGIGSRKMADLIARGEIPSRTIGDRRIIRRSALEEYLRDGEGGDESCSAIERQVFVDRVRNGKPAK